MIRFISARLRMWEDRGVALVSVIAVGAVTAILVTTAIATSVASVQASRNDQDVSGALAAAYAGIEEYQSLLANNPAYVRFGNPASEYTSPPSRPDLQSDVALPPAATANPAFDIGTAGRWTPVQGSSDTAHFRYEVNNSQFDETGVVTLRSTGRVADATRTIIADLKQDGFVAYVYFTDLETSDPYSETSTCNRYAWGNPARPTSCGEIKFDGGDTLDGDVHSNDTMVICNATFKKAVTTEYKPASGNAYKLVASAPTCVPNFQLGAPVTKGHIEMPPTNNALLKETRTDLTASDVPRPGCLYTGPTSIVFNSNGTMTVISPWTKKTQTDGDSATAINGAAPAMCGNIAQLNSTAGATFPVPDNNVVYVQNVPGATNNINYSATPPAGVRCDPTTVNGQTVRANNGLGYPLESEKAAASAYGCRNGDLFVKGTTNGKITLSSANFIYVVGDTAYADPQDDVLGLVGQNAVYVWNPINDSNDCLPGYCNTNRTIQAAILSVKHTFTVQNFAEIGYRGELQITGSIAQRYRGPVGNGSTTTINNGYKKKYTYDTRFKYTAPPKFLAPLTTTYGVTTFIEVDSVFDSDGTYR